MQTQRVAHRGQVESNRRHARDIGLRLVKARAAPRCPGIVWCTGVAALVVLVGPLFFLHHADRLLVLQAACGGSALLLLGQLPDSRRVWQMVGLPLVAGMAFYAALLPALALGLAVLAVSFGVMSLPAFERPRPERWWLKWMSALMSALAVFAIF